MDKIWLKHYPAGVPHEIDPSAYRSLVELMADGFTRHARLAAFCFMGQSWSFARIDAASSAMGAYLQGLGLKPGDRVAVMLPNIPQYPVAVAAILRAGYVVVNVNPLYTPRELAHQLQDSGSKAIFILENFATTLQQVQAQTPVQHVILATMGDMLGLVKGSIVNHVVRHVKKLVPAFSLPQAVGFKAALREGRGAGVVQASPGPDDVAVLQYTGGTTGLSKGATLLHRNIIANLLQSEAWNEPMVKQIPPGEPCRSITSSVSPAA